MWKILSLTLLFLASCSERVYKSFLREASLQAAQASAPASPCTQFMNYAPDASFPRHTPMRHVRVNFHIMNNRDSTLNFNMADGTAYARALIEQANRELANNQKMSLPEDNTTPVLPMRYRYIITPDTENPDDAGVYVHYDEELAYFNKKGTSANATMSQEMFSKYGSRKGEVLNIFLIEHHPDSARSPTYHASVDGVGFKDWVKVIGSFQHLNPVVKQDDGTEVRYGPVYRSRALNHETGHTFGLSHTWNAHDGCDDTPMNPGCWDQFSSPCRETGIYSNNMMDYNNCQCAVTPCQIAKIQYNFSSEGSSQRRLLQPVWCEYKKDSSITIGFLENAEWKCSKDLEGDIIIGNGGRLTIHCEVALPIGAKIIVKPKGRLILNGATITNKCGDQWQGIETWRSRKNEGEVIFINNPVLKNVMYPVTIRSGQMRQ